MQMEGGGNCLPLEPWLPIQEHSIGLEIRQYWSTCCKTQNGSETTQLGNNVRWSPHMWKTRPMHGSRHACGWGATFQNIHKRVQNRASIASGVKTSGTHSVKPAAPELHTATHDAAWFDSHALGASVGVMCGWGSIPPGSSVHRPVVADLTPEDEICTLCSEGSN